MKRESQRTENVSSKELSAKKFYFNQRVQMINIPKIHLGIISVSRDCFPISLSTDRRHKVVSAYSARYGEIYDCPITVQNEEDMLNALKDVKQKGINALVVYLGNFGPETAETLLTKYFNGPVMYAAAAEEDISVLASNRGDAFCGMLNCSYNLDLRNLKAYIPTNPIGTAEEVAQMIAEFVPLARTILGLKSLKILTFGPRPQDFLACNGPIKNLYDLGIEIEENSELDLLVAYKNHKGDPRIPEKVNEMASELGEGNRMAGILPRLAQYELTLLDIYEAHKGASDFVIFANKCWPAFQTEFGFVPCYINSRLTAMGIPISCEVDIYGALSEFIGTCVSDSPVTLLDINNTVPGDLYDKEIKEEHKYEKQETFMGFHCGNTPICRLKNGTMKYQLIMHRGLEPDKEPDITRGTLEGDLTPGPITLFRLQSTADSTLKAYVAEGEVLPAATHSFGSIGVIGIPQMHRFYRNVLIAKHFPHHGAVAFGHWGKMIYSIFQYLGIGDISYNHPKELPYDGENPFHTLI